jgi:hypothetical protein
MEPAQVVETELYADHSQFYLVDPSIEWRADLVWDGPGLERHVGVTDGFVAVGTVGHCEVPVRVEVWDAEPPADFDDWDHVVDVSVEVLSGRLELGEVGGSAELGPVHVEPGSYRVRSSAAGLAEADEVEGGDRYRLQLWPAPPGEAAVRKWWPAWDPSGVVAQPTSEGGRTLLGAEAHEARIRMRWLASRGVAHLFRDDDGTLWEHSTLENASGLAQLEELDEVEAERRYGSAESWSSGTLDVPGFEDVLRNIADTLRYASGWRPDPDPPEAVLEDGRRVYVGNTAANRLFAMRWVASAGGDNLHVDEEGAFWELRRRGGPREKQRLVELSRAEAEAKYGEGV